MKSSLPGTPSRQLSPHEAVRDGKKKRSKELELGLRSHPDDRLRPTRQARRVYLGKSRVTDASNDRYEKEFDAVQDVFELQVC